jgi:hypothetical protein
MGRRAKERKLRRLAEQRSPLPDQGGALIGFNDARDGYVMAPDGWRRMPAAVAVATNEKRALQDAAAEEAARTVAMPDVIDPNEVEQGVGGL